jgi:hypothetical protein
MSDRLRAALLAFAIVAGIGAVYGFLHDYTIGGTVLAAAMLGVLVVGVGWVATIIDEGKSKRPSLPTAPHNAKAARI